MSHLICINNVCILKLYFFVVVFFGTFKGLLPYFFGYKTVFFFFQNNLKDLDPSCKTDLDLLDCLGRVNLVFIAKFHRTDLLI